MASESSRVVAGDSILDRLLQDVIEISFGGGCRKSIPHGASFSSRLSQSGKQRAIQFLRAGSFRFGFDEALVARFQVQ
jgi:hypothetical protein